MDTDNDIGVVGSIVHIVFVPFSSIRRCFPETQCMALRSYLVRYLDREVNVDMLYRKLGLAEVQASRKGHDDSLHEGEGVARGL